MIISKIRTLFYSKETKKVDELFPTRSNVLNCSSDIEFDGTLYFNGTVNGNVTCKNLKAGSRSLITGNINSDKISIKSTAEVEGVLSQKNLSIDEGAKLKIKAETY